MPLSTVLKFKCPKCGVKTETATEYKMPGGMTIFTYKCGHIEMRETLPVADYATIISLTKKKMYPFQVIGAKFVETANGRCLIADEMALGKTVQAAAVFSKHNEDMSPALFIVKSGLRIQWLRAIIDWTGLVPQIIESATSYILPGMPAYIISVDMLRRFPQNLTKQLGIKTVVIDEVQSIKNPDSARTKEVRRLTDGVEYVIALSGTPIKNHAGEYFTILNILRPDKFPSYSRFLQDWCHYSAGYRGQKVQGLRKPEAFKAFTEDFIIRRTRAEVLPDLPPVKRDFLFCELGEEVEQAYIAHVKAFQKYVDETDDTGFEKQTNILAYLAKMRHITGLAKVETTVNFVEEFLSDTDRKITLFVHHKDVAYALKTRIEKLNPDAFLGEEVLTLSSDQNMEQRQEAVDKFWQNGHRVLIASTLASGEGWNLQCCSDFVTVERQWNPANEEQAEARFPRPGQTADKINGTYPIAIGTVDEFFSELVEKKREYVGSALDGKAIPWDESKLVSELTELIMMKGGQRWGF